MKYLLIALINAIYGIMLLVNLTKDTPGFFLIASIGGIITILGLSGLGLWIRDFVTSIRTGEKESTAIKSWWQIAKGVDILLILGLLFRAFVLQPFIVDGNSMEPNFHNNEYLLVNQMTYRLRAPERGETIIFRFPKDPQEDYIKRIIGLPEEKIDIFDGKVYINNSLLDEKYLSPDEQTTVSDINFSRTLNADEYFVMGDNREHSSDSREWGPMPKKNIIGRAWLDVYPFKDYGLIKNGQFNLIPQSVFLPTTYFKSSITSWSRVWSKFS